MLSVHLKIAHKIVSNMWDGDRKCASANTCSSEGVLFHLPHASRPIPLTASYTPLAFRHAPPPAWLVFLYGSQEMPTNIVSVFPKYTMQYFVWHY